MGDVFAVVMDFMGDALRAIPLTTAGLVLDFIGVVLVAISNVGFVRTPDGGLQGAESWITAGRISRLLANREWDLEKLSARANFWGWLLLLAGLALQIWDSLR